MSRDSSIREQCLKVCLYRRQLYYQHLTRKTYEKLQSIPGAHNTAAILCAILKPDLNPIL